jgi:hypothetical protein
MSSLSSMMYTIGTALTRAHEQEHPVQVLVEGMWLSGLVVACDGTGVVLEDDEYEHSVVRLEHISAVRVQASSPLRRKIPGTPAPRPGFGGHTVDGAMPMPGPSRRAS